MTVQIHRRAFGLAFVADPAGAARVDRALAVRAPATLMFVREAERDGQLERETAIASLLSVPSAPRVLLRDDVTFRAVGREMTLGVSLVRLLMAAREEGGRLDGDIAAYLLEAIGSFMGDVLSVSGDDARVLADDVWLGWDGSVRCYDASTWPDSSETGPQSASIEVVAAAHDARAVDGASAAAGQRALPGLLAAMFPRDRERDLEWLDELFIDEITETDLFDAPGPTAQELVHRAVVVDDGIAPAILVTDLVPCSVMSASQWAHLARLVPADASMMAAGRPRAAPIVSLSLEHAALIAASLDDFRSVNPWHLPTDAEWDRLSQDGGVGRPSRFGVRGLCRLWEMTSTPRHGAVIVRGGKWRDRAQLAVIANTSWEDRPSADVGFRAVRYVNDDDAPWEPRT